MPGARVLFLVVELGALTFRPGDTVQEQCRRDRDVRRRRRGRDPRQQRPTARRSARAASTPGRDRSTSWAGGSRRTASASCSRATSRLWCASASAPPSTSSSAGTTCRFHSIDSCLPSRRRQGGRWTLGAGVRDADAAALADCREVLRNYGNMSAATVMFVLERALRRRAGGRHLMSALGPGFTAAFQIVEG